MPRRVAKEKMRPRMRAYGHRERTSTAEASHRVDLLRRQERDFLGRAPRYHTDVRPVTGIEDDQPVTAEVEIREGRVRPTREEQRRDRNEHAFERAW